MKTLASNRSKRKKPFSFNEELLKLTIGGGFAFWATTIVTSVLPIAAKYRAAFSNWSILETWAGSLLMGMLIGCCVSYSLLRRQARTPASDPIQKALRLSASALIVALILVDIPMFLRGSGDALHYLLIGMLFNTIRFVFLGAAIGLLYKRLHSTEAA